MASSGDCSKDGCYYGYLQYEPSLAGNALLLALFAVLLPIACILCHRYHSSVFSTIVATGLCLEVIAYASRLLLATHEDGDKTEFVLSYIATILAPTIISLAIFRLMPPVVAAYGEQFRAWRPSWHNVVFYALTAICVVLQAVGGVLSTVPNDRALNDTGVRVLVAGFAVHISSLLIFTLLGFRFALAVRERKGGLDTSGVAVYNKKRFSAFLFGLGIATLLLSTRTFYRMIAISEGLSSALAQNEILFLVLDGVLVFIASALIIALFPGRMLGGSWREPLTHKRKMSQKTVNRPAPIQLQQGQQYRASYSPKYRRVSLKSSNNVSPRYSPRYSPRHSPRKAVVPQRNANLVDSNALW
ncbi:hypothetical protein JX265_002106 [Neoarthrinium moseri]|uniref:Uncharacterized protein n=1 Tax=Neoarthrinium moseri TaxID=1658444 RepID=A0A9P9WUB8_9PEZI|nr:uncharacterized protein JN550_001767 [Neoarthrinium moseri]KAI1850209.1 hypothetical protein JX266_004067 [Neoarthrinium moseri]KAI1876271.1 hypothetical protein JN550_001767 [Neoarthrinium moseri]KAI1879152.1 hypothetical protein JX265_002106 [Neoarthrinium moseri]